eukprot:2641519-Pyramimonas_sp.AAC.1
MAEWRVAEQEIVHLQGNDENGYEPGVFLVVKPTQALVDPGAGSDLVGLTVLNRESRALADIGLRYA